MQPVRDNESFNKLLQDTNHLINGNKISLDKLSAKNAKAIKEFELESQKLARELESLEIKEINEIKEIKIQKGSHESGNKEKKIRDKEENEKMIAIAIQLFRENNENENIVTFGYRLHDFEEKTNELVEKNKSVPLFASFASASIGLINSIRSSSGVRNTTELSSREGGLPVNSGSAYGLFPPASPVTPVSKTPEPLPPMPGASPTSSPRSHSAEITNANDALQLSDEEEELTEKRALRNTILNKPKICGDEFQSGYGSSILILLSVINRVLIITYVDIRVVLLQFINVNGPTLDIQDNNIRARHALHNKLNKYIPSDKNEMYVADDNITRMIDMLKSEETTITWSKIKNGDKYILGKINNQLNDGLDDTLAQLIRLSGDNLISSSNINHNDKPNGHS